MLAAVPGATLPFPDRSWKAPPTPGVRPAASIQRIYVRSLTQWPSVGVHAVSLVKIAEKVGDLRRAAEPCCCLRLPRRQRPFTGECALGGDEEPFPGQRGCERSV